MGLVTLLIRLGTLILMVMKANDNSILKEISRGRHSCY